MPDTELTVSFTKVVVRIAGNDMLRLEGWSAFVFVAVVIVALVKPWRWFCSD